MEALWPHRQPHRTRAVFDSGPKCCSKLLAMPWPNWLARGCSPARDHWEHCFPAPQYFGEGHRMACRASVGYGSGHCQPALPGCQKMTLVSVPLVWLRLPPPQGPIFLSSWSCARPWGGHVCLSELLGVAVLGVVSLCCDTSCPVSPVSLGAGTRALLMSGETPKGWRRMSLGAM